MSPRPKQAILRLILALYCVYAISPLYLSTLSGREHVLAGRTEPGIMMGIVWVKVVLSSLVDVRPGDAPAVMQADEQGREFILIRKKRALFSETFRVRPVFEEGAVLAPSLDRLEPPAGAVDDPRSLQVWHNDTPLSRHLGLSPPSFV